jgi:peptidoglycan-associated lipoprotein
MLRSINLALVIVIVGVSAAFGQRGPENRPDMAPRFDLSGGFNHINSNAPPGQTNYFGLNGGYVSGDVYLTDWFSLGGEFTAGHANDISLLGQNLTLFTYLGGPKVSRTGHRLAPYADVLFGGAHGSDSYFPTATSSTTSASSWALSAGGGLDVNLTRRFAIRAFDVDYLRTALPNGTNDAQNHLMIGAGIVIKFNPKEHVLAVAPVVHRPGEIIFTCGTNVANVEEGQPLEVTGHTLTEPDRLDVSYVWTSNGGKIEGSGRDVTLNTAGLPAGDYRITGHAALVSSPTTTAECDAEFRVNGNHSNSSDDVGGADKTAEAAKKDAIFHENVQDALFDYDSSDIRQDAQIAIKHAAQYLKDNPAIRVLVEGYADERGSAEYNLALGAERANAARNALLADGLDPERIQVISYGKEAQVCTAETEACWQQNRRAAFSMHP